MDAKFIQSLTEGLIAQENGSTIDVVYKMRSFGADVLAVRDARDGFTKILRQVRSGAVKIVGHSPDKQVVLISAKDLSEMVGAVFEPYSFMDLLRADPGYDPPAIAIGFAERPRSRERTWPENFRRSYEPT